MQYLLKFIKYLTIIVVAYIFIYVLYVVNAMSNTVDTHFVTLLGALIVFLCWAVIGMVSPKKLPFWNGIKSRFAILMIGTFVIICIVAMFVAIEVSLLRRNPLKVAYINVYYMYTGFSRIHPFTDNALTKVSTLQQTKNSEEINQWVASE